MGNLFGRKKKPESRVTEQDKAVLQLKQQRDKLKQYQKKINAQLVKDREVARQLLKDGKKDKALLMLRKKKFQESLLEKTDKQLDNIEQMVQDLEFAQIETQVINGLKTGNESLKKIQRLMSLEDVESIMDETRDAAAYQQEIDDLLAGGLTDEDEEDVLAELEEITKVELPDVPEDDLRNEEESEREPRRVKSKTTAREAVLAS